MTNGNCGGPIHHRACRTLLYDRDRHEGIFQKAMRAAGPFADRPPVPHGVSRRKRKSTHGWGDSMEAAAHFAPDDPANPFVDRNVIAGGEGLDILAEAREANGHPIIGLVICFGRGSHAISYRH